MSQSLQSGAVLGPYEIHQLIGVGGMGEVYRASNKGLMRDEAIKVLPRMFRSDPEIVARFLNDARTAAGLRHPNIVTIFAVADAQDPVIYFAMELIDGEDLATYIERRGKLSIVETVDLLRQLASALDYAHEKGVVHRDMKPANVLIAGGTAKVVDFGIARVLGSNTRLTQEGMLIGTARYMAPEQATGGVIGPATDQYSLAIVAYEFLCGRPPFEGKAGDSDFALLYAHTHHPPPPPNEVNTSLSRSTSDALLKALSKDPQKRFPNCKAFVEALSTTDRSPARPKKNVPTLAVAVAVVGVGLIGVALLRSGTDGTGNGVQSPISSPDSAPVAAPSPPDKIVLDNWVGKDVEEAQARLKEQGFEVQVKRSHDRARAGTVIEQSPSGGESLDASANVSLVASSGPFPEQPAVVTRAPVISPPVDDTYLTEADLQGKSRWELDILRNTPYARRGYRFRRKDLQNYFSQFSWYRPLTSNGDGIYKVMSAVERHNVDLIGAYERQHSLLK